ncbi:ATP-binding protein [Candidatus Woesearchaeota archaeon]|nr:ATP-binding protein [Candidatus Woesearchaeota archaeon]
MKTKTEFVDITPHRSIMLKLGQSGYSISEALAELIDNSIDASIPDKKLSIDISVSSNKIVISDNGSGMPKDVASKVLKLGFSTKEKEAKLGKFGLGLKTSCLSLGKSFVIKTSPLNSGEEFTVSFDEDEWINSGDWSRHPMSISEGIPKNVSYSRITINNIIVKFDNKELEKLADEFGLRFGPFIESDSVEILINKKFCKPALPKLTSHGKKDFEIKLSTGWVLKGWFGFKLAGSVKEYYGFNTFRRGRLITTYDKIGLSKDPKAKQIVGEIYMDHVPVSHNKRNWIIQSEEYKIVSNELTKFLRDYDVRQKKIVSGFPAHPGRVEGIARVLFLGARTNAKDLERIKPGDILVTSMTRPQYLLQIRRAGAIVTDMGGMLCHAAIVSREFNIPCIVGTQNGMQKIKDGQKIIVDANEGVVYEAE